ncbi:MAG TPA: Fic/DOC family N-terminal domain-containing protein [Kiritimatiellia bacterium]|nr:Fic/DOC family N-terminal domain-containing protein [Kiritimatiellia bacterium]
MTFDPNKPHNDLPALPPKAEVETRAVLKRVISATRAVAELKGVGGVIPNQSMLVNTLALQEARASSEIENIITTNDAMFQAMASSAGATDPATKEVMRYREALWEGFNRVQAKGRLNAGLFVDLVQMIKQDAQGIRNRPGTVIGNTRTREIIYTPPEGEKVIRRMLADLERFIHADDNLEPLVKLALIHYQFEAIHPFFDGNGRTGRLINILFLVHKGLLDLPVLYLSKYIIDRKPEYYRLLRQVTERGSWEPWVLYMLEAVEATSILTRKRILAIRALLDETLALAKQKLPPRVYSKDLIELIFRQPYTKGQFIVEAGLAERQTAAEYLKELENIGILSTRKVGRENLYLNLKLYDLLSK